MDTNTFIALAVQVPLVSAFLIALEKGWIYIGKTIDRERESQKATIEKEREDRKVEREFLLNLRQEAITDKRTTEDRAEKLALTMKEATGLMTRTVDLNERMFEELRRNG